jgi:hypothetical protein
MAHSSDSFWGGILKSMGLVFGDIGTSPIYTLTVIFALTEPSRDNILGIISLILWTLTILVTVEYAWLATSLSRNGEGGAIVLRELDVDVHLSTADQAGLLGEIVGQLVVDELWPAIGDGLLCLPERIVLVTAAANRPDDAAVAEHEHLGAHALRRRAGRGHDRDERSRFPPFERIGDGGEDFLVHGLRGL